MTEPNIPIDVVGIVEALRTKSVWTGTVTGDPVEDVWHINQQVITAVGWFEVIDQTPFLAPIEDFRRSVTLGEVKCLPPKHYRRDGRMWLDPRWGRNERRPSLLAGDLESPTLIVETAIDAAVVRRRGERAQCLGVWLAMGCEREQTEVIVLPVVRSNKRWADPAFCHFRALEAR